MRQSNGGNRLARVARKTPAIPAAGAGPKTMMPSGEMVRTASSIMPRGEMTSARPAGPGPMPRGEMVPGESSSMPRGAMTPVAQASRA
jgi:hypothetical protein